jgi:adenosylmethionine-8-amino-7-oxononanoate aminotransferase
MDMRDVVENMFLPLPGVPPLLITRTHGVYLEEASGMKIIDASGGPMAVNIGYGRQEVAAAAAKVLGEVSYVLPVFASKARIELVKRIKKRLPEELNEVYFCSGGSEANEAAIKFARQYQVLTGKSSKFKVISRKLSYHGMTFFALSASDVKSRQRDFAPMLWDVPKIEPCYCYRCPFGGTYPGCGLECAHAFEKKILEVGPETIAAFIAEPIVASAGGGLVPPPEYFPIIRKACDKYDIVFIMDEIVTGFGRTGKNMAMEHFGVVPDIVTFAKGVSSGYAPLAGMAVRDEMAATFKETGAEFQHLYTFSAHTLACAVGNEVQRIMEEENLVAQAEKTGRYLRQQLVKLLDLPMVGDIRGEGMLFALEFVRDKKTREPFPKERNLKMELITTCMLKGVFFYPGYYEDEQGQGDHIMVAPPFIITEEQIDTCMQVLSETIVELSGKG